MKINKHGALIDKSMAGNGYHGRCEHCGLALVTDLGYSSWEGFICIDREVNNYSDIPKELRSYVQFHGLKWDRNTKVFVKPYSKLSYTIDELNKLVIKLVE